MPISSSIVNVIIGACSVQISPNCLVIAFELNLGLLKPLRAKIINIDFSCITSILASMKDTICIFYQAPNWIYSIKS